jgi:enamine deaminase RidA (YjgF/YER057c/UK114 family)
VCAPISEYSNVVVSNDARQLAFISGQVALRADGAFAADMSIEGQTRQVFENLGRCLDAVGMSWSNVVKWTTYLTEAADVGGFYAVRRALFEDFYPSGNYPGNSLLIVKGLVRPELLVEIEAVAAA